MKEQFSGRVGGKLFRHLMTASALGAVALLAACGDKEPTGQVVAVVNGDEITLQELNAEMGAAQIPDGADESEVRNRALARVIDRRLLAGVARDEGIDATPEFIVRRRQMEEALLVQMLGQQTARTQGEPAAADVDKFIADNPQMFADRLILGLDQIRFQTPSRDDYIQQLGETKTMAEVVAVLNRLGIRFERGNVRVDSASLPPEMFARIKQVGNSEPFVVPGPAIVSVSYLVASQPAPVTGEQARPAATNAFQQRAVARALEEKMETAKGEAGIDYQPGFGPSEAGTEENEALAPTPAESPAAPDDASSG